MYGIIDKNELMHRKHNAVTMDIFFYIAAINYLFVCFLFYL